MQAFVMYLRSRGQAYKLSVDADGLLRLEPGHRQAGDASRRRAVSGPETDEPHASQWLFEAARRLTYWLEQERPFALTFASASLHQQKVFERLALRVRQRVPWYEIYEADGVFRCYRRVDHAGDQRPRARRGYDSVREQAVAYGGRLAGAFHASGRLLSL